MTAAAQAPTSKDPDPPRANAALGRVLSFVRKLIDDGKQLAATVQQRATAADFVLLVRLFGTADLAVILARITSGLRRAAALEVELCRRAAHDRDPTSSSVRSPAARGSRPARRVTPPDAQPEPPPANRTEDPRLARLPTEEEIAADMRRRPVGAVIADICRNLGIAPGQLDRTFWDEFSRAIIVYGGNLVGLPRQPASAAARVRLRRPCRPSEHRMARSTPTTAGARHRPALSDKPA